MKILLTSQTQTHLLILRKNMIEANFKLRCLLSFPNNITSHPGIPLAILRRQERRKHQQHKNIKMLRAQRFSGTVRVGSLLFSTNEKSIGVAPFRLAIWAVGTLAATIDAWKPLVSQTGKQSARAQEKHVYGIVYCCMAHTGYNLYWFWVIHMSYEM